MIAHLKNLIRPIYFRLYHLFGYPGIVLHRATIRDIVKEYNQVYTYVVSKPAGLTFTAGQYVHLVAPRSIIDQNSVRHMSIASGPEEDCLRFTMDLSSNSKFKKKFATARVGDQIGIHSVKGHFSVDKKEAEDRALVFIAGGIGITPIRSIVSDLNTVPWRLIYAGKGYCYRDFWNHTGNLKKIKFTNRETVLEALQNVIDTSPKDSLYYLCGSSEFVATIRGFLANNRIEDHQVILENFGDI